MTRRLGRLVRSSAAPVLLAASVVSGCSVASATETRVEITMRYSHFEPTRITVPRGVAVTFVLRNNDPIDHEWIVGDEELHRLHRSGTETHHDSRPTEVSVDAGTTRTTTVTFDQPATLTFVCHLPGHEAYGMVGVLVVE